MIRRDYEPDNCLIVPNRRPPERPERAFSSSSFHFPVIHCVAESYESLLKPNSTN